jgi:hypothetical protein
MKPSIASDVAEKNRSWIRLLAGKLRDWLDDYLAEDRTKDRGEQTSPAAAPELDAPEDAGPPEHWLALVQQYAPQLLIPSERGTTPNRLLDPNLSDRICGEGSRTAPATNAEAQHPGLTDSHLPITQTSPDSVPSFHTPFYAPREVAGSYAPREVAAKSSSDDMGMKQNSSPNPGPRIVESGEFVGDRKVLGDVPVAAPTRARHKPEPHPKQSPDVRAGHTEYKHADASFVKPGTSEEPRKKLPVSDKVELRVRAGDVISRSNANPSPEKKSEPPLRPLLRVQKPGSTRIRASSEDHPALGEGRWPTPTKSAGVQQNRTRNFHSEVQLNPRETAFEGLRPSAEPPSDGRSHKQNVLLPAEFHHAVVSSESPLPGLSQSALSEPDLWPELPVEADSIPSWRKSFTAAEHIAFLDREQRGGY